MIDPMVSMNFKIKLDILLFRLNPAINTIVSIDLYNELTFFRSSPATSSIVTMSL